VNTAGARTEALPGLKRALPEPLLPQLDQISLPLLQPQLDPSSWPLLQLQSGRCHLQLQSHRCHFSLSHPILAVLLQNCQI
jgi:hypothetical protein